MLKRVAGEDGVLIINGKATKKDCEEAYLAEYGSEPTSIDLYSFDYLTGEELSHWIETGEWL